MYLLCVKETPQQSDELQKYPRTPFVDFVNVNTKVKRFTIISPFVLVFINSVVVCCTLVVLNLFSSSLNVVTLTHTYTKLLKFHIIFNSYKKHKYS